MTSVVYIDEQGRPRHTNCHGRFCRVPHCRDSMLAEPDPDGRVNLPDTFYEQVIEYATPPRPDPCPDCGTQLEDAPGGGVRCPSSTCTYWFCY